MKKSNYELLSAFCVALDPFEHAFKFLSAIHNFIIYSGNKISRFGLVNDECINRLYSAIPDFRIALSGHLSFQVE